MGFGGKVGAMHSHASGCHVQSCTSTLHHTCSVCSVRPVRGGRRGCPPATTYHVCTSYIRYHTSHVLLISVRPVLGGRRGCPPTTSHTTPPFRPTPLPTAATSHGYTSCTVCTIVRHINHTSLVCSRHSLCEIRRGQGVWLRLAGHTRPQDGALRVAPAWRRARVGGVGERVLLTGPEYGGHTSIDMSHN